MSPERPDALRNVMKIENIKYVVCFDCFVYFVYVKLPMEFI